MGLFPQPVGKTAKRSVFRKTVQSPSFAFSKNLIPFSSKDRSVSSRISSKRSLHLSALLIINMRRPFFNDSSLTNQKDGLSSSLNLTNQDFYVRLVDEKNKENNSILAGRSFSLPRSFEFSPFLRPATQAKCCHQK